MITNEDIARVCHEANRAFCLAHGDRSQEHWEQAADWQRESAIKGVEFRLANQEAPISAQHEAWMDAKIADGWTYGAVKDAAMKTHPCLVPYANLPDEQKTKDVLFVEIVEALRPETY